MENLRAFVTRAIVCAFILLLFVDVVDDLCLANRWAGCPTELYPLIGAIIAAIFTSETLRKRDNGNGGKEKTH